METLQTVKMVHRATPQNITPAYEGLAAVLNSKASVTEITIIHKRNVQRLEIKLFQELSK